MKKIIFSFVFAIITTVSFARQVVLSEELTKYLPLTGGILTGNLMIGTNYNETESGIYSLCLGKNVLAAGENSFANGIGEYSLSFYIQKVDTTIDSKIYKHLATFSRSSFPQLYSMIDNFPDITKFIKIRHNVDFTEINVTEYIIDNDKLYFNLENDTTVSGSSYTGIWTYYVTASGNYSHAEGCSTLASGNSSHAEGYLSTANGNSSHAEGQSTIANGYSSHAEGSYTLANAYYSHAEGQKTAALGQYSHAEGSLVTAGGTGAHAEGGNPLVQKVFDEILITAPNNSYTCTTTNDSTFLIVGNYLSGYMPNYTMCGKILDISVDNNMVKTITLDVPVTKYGNVNDYSIKVFHPVNAVGDFSHTDGYRSYATNHYAYVWNGITNNNYYSNGEGTYNINPIGGMDGFYIGEKPLSSLKWGNQEIFKYTAIGDDITVQVPVSTTNGAVQFFIIEQDEPGTFELVLPEPIKSDYGSLILFIEQQSVDCENYVVLPDNCYSLWWPQSQPWSTHDENVIWKTKWESPPGTTNWYFMGADKYPL